MFAYDFQRAYRLGGALTLSLLETLSVAHLVSPCPAILAMCKFMESLMRRREAEDLVGQSVIAWTAANGIYVGELTQVWGSPWRGAVRITGVVEPAQHYERGGLCRRGFRPGEVIEVGNSSIRPATEPGYPTYLAAIEARLAWHAAELAKYPEGRYSWIHEVLPRALEAAAAAEKNRMECGIWLLVPLKLQVDISQMTWMRS